MRCVIAPVPAGKKIKGPRQPHPGARRPRYRCSLPGLTGFTDSRREGTGADPVQGYAVSPSAASPNFAGSIAITGLQRTARGIFLQMLQEFASIVIGNSQA